MCKFYNIPDYDSYLKSSTLNERPIALKSLCFLLNFINDHNAKLTQKIHLPTFDNNSGHLHLANHSLNQLNIDLRYLNMILNRFKYIQIF